MPLESGVPMKVVVEITTPGNVRNLNIFYAIRNDVSPGFMPDDDVRDAVTDGLIAIYQPISPDMVVGSEVVDWKSDKMVWDAVNEQWVVSANFVTAPLGIDGQAIEDMLPQQCAAVVTAACDKVRCRPKKFFPGFGEASQADGVLIPISLGHLVTSAVAWLTAMPVAPYSLVWVTLANDGTVQFLNGSTANSILGTQRRRKIGVGM